MKQNLKRHPPNHKVHVSKGSIQTEVSLLVYGDLLAEPQQQATHVTDAISSVVCTRPFGNRVV
jgi:hypothetical protein